MNLGLESESSTEVGGELSTGRGDTGAGVKGRTSGRDNSGAGVKGRTLSIGGVEDVRAGVEVRARAGVEVRARAVETAGVGAGVEVQAGTVGTRNGEVTRDSGGCECDANGMP